MSAEVIDQGIFWLFCFVTGAVITFIYDQIRIVRRVLPHGSVLVAIEDLLFWLFAGIVIFSLLYRMNAGTLRWFAVFGLATGMFLYKKIFRDFLVNFMSTVIRRILDIVVRILGIPLNFVKRPVIKGLRAIRSGRNRLKKKLTANIKEGKITLCKHKNQLEMGNRDEPEKVSGKAAESVWYVFGFGGCHCVDADGFHQVCGETLKDNENNVRALCIQ